MTMTLGERITYLPPSPEHYEIADMIGLSHEDATELATTTVHNLGNVVMMGTGEKHPVLRVHVGPEGAPAGGGTKFKGYGTPEAHLSDTVDHGDSMFWKNRALGQVRNGGKTVANINWRAYNPDQVKDAAHQVGRLYARAGLANPAVDRTAADEGTGPYIMDMIAGMRDEGIEYPESCITGKPDMKPRNPATGRGGAIATRALMGMRGQDKAGFVVQGAGPAGLFYAAEAYDPLKDADRKKAMPVFGLGDLDPKTKKPASLVTDHPEGLPITHDMAHSILEHPEDDDHMKQEGGYKLAALARKIEARGVKVDIVDKDILTYSDEGLPNKVNYLVPAATSNVLTLDNIGDVTINEWIEIGNHVVHALLAPHIGGLGFRKHPGERYNAGGAFMSDLEHFRDLAKIAAEKVGNPYTPDSDEVFNDKLHTGMTEMTLRDYAIAEEYGVTVEKAVKMVGMACAAIATGKSISDRMSKLLTAQV